MSDQSEDVEEPDAAEHEDDAAGAEAEADVEETESTGEESDPTGEESDPTGEESGAEGAEATEETGEAEAEEEAEEEEETGLQDGDFVRLDYTARTVEGGQLVDTTDPEVAEEEGVADQGTFEPRVIVLGSGHLFEAVEEDIVGKEAGEGGSVLVPSGEAFGEYDESQVETVSASKIDEDDRYPGARLQIDGRQGTLETIIGGRARVDFNHPLAGEDVEYEYEIVDVVDDQLERARGLLNMFLDMDLEMRIEDEEVEETRVEQPDPEEEGEEGEEGEPETVTETVEKRTLYVEATPQLSMNQQWLFQKQQIAQEVIDKTGIDRMIVEEVLDGTGGMMGGMGGMMGGMGGGGDVDVEEALEEADIDPEEIVDDIEE